MGRVSQKAKVGTPAGAQETEGTKTTGRGQTGVHVLSLVVLNFRLVPDTCVFVIQFLVL